MKLCSTTVIRAAKKGGASTPADGQQTNVVKLFTCCTSNCAVPERMSGCCCCCSLSKQADSTPERSSNVSLSEASSLSLLAVDIADLSIPELIQRSVWAFRVQEKGA